MKQINARIDNTPPPVYKHMQYKAKKVALTEERFKEIARENQVRVVHKCL